MTDSQLEIEDLDDEEVKGLQLTSLPDEIMLKILSYLKTAEILKSLALVCHHFYRLSRDPSVIKDIYLKPYMDNSSQLYITEAIERSRGLKSLTLKGRSDAEHLVSTAAKSCPKLHTLQIIGCSKLSDDCIALLVESEVCQSLQVLNLECTPISTHWGTSQVIKLANLTSLNLFNSRVFDSEHLKALAYNCDKLQHLNLEEVTHLSEESVIIFIQERRDTLKSLYLDGESLSDKTFRNLFQCKNLESLGISFAEDMGQDGIESIAQLHQLRLLKLKRAKNVKADDFITLFAEANLRQLQDLDLSECTQVNDEVIKTLAIECPHLQKVMLNWCWEIRDAGMEFLIRYSNNISQLYLVGVVLLTDAFLQDLEDHLPKLTFLDLQQCPNLTDQVLIDLVALWPTQKLEVVNYYGESIICSEEPNRKPSEDAEDKSGSDSSSTTEGAALSDDISDGFSEAEN